MSLVIPKTVSFGGSKTGLVGTIGITLLKPDGLVHVARSTIGIYEIGGGCYGKNITFDDGWAGSIKWDTGGGTPVYAIEDYEIEGMIQNIETDTNDLQTNQGAWLTATGFSVPNEYDLRMTAIQNDLDDPNQYKANITTLATEANATINKTDIVAEVNANEVKIDTIITTLSTMIAGIWNHTPRTLTSFGTLVADITTSVWVSGTRTLTSFGTLVADIATSVWTHLTRTLTSHGTLVNDINTELTTQHGVGDWTSTNITGIPTLAEIEASTVLAKQADLLRVLGLMQENHFMDNTVYDGSSNLVSARIRIYSVAGSVGTVNNVIATYTITANYTGQDLDTFGVVRV